MCHKFYFPFGGAERYVLDLSKRLVRAGDTVIPFAMRHPRNLSTPYERYFVSHVDFNGSLRTPTPAALRAAGRVIYSFEALRKARRLIREQRPQLAHVHNIFHQLSPSIFRAFRELGIPAVMTVHDYKLVCPAYYLFSRGSVCERCRGGRFHNVVWRRCLKDSYAASAVACLETSLHRRLGSYEENVATFIAPTRFVKRKLEEHGIAAGKIEVLPHSIDLSDYRPRPGQGEHVLYVGRLSPEKGVLTLLRAMKTVRSRPLLVVGDGLQREELVRFAKTEGLDHVAFLGPKTGAELRDLIRGALLVVVPSVWYEVTGLVLYEAFACGKPVVASRIGGIPEVVDDGVNGLLVEPGNPDELAAAIQHLLDRPALVAEMGGCALEKVRRLNDETAHLERLAEIYERALAPGSSRLEAVR